MARAKSRSRSQKYGDLLRDPVPSGMSKKQMKRKKPIDSSYLRNIEPLTDHQEEFFTAYAEGKNCVLHGAAGTGKTFIVLYNACLLYTSPSPRDQRGSRMPSSA